MSSGAYQAAGFYFFGHEALPRVPVASAGDFQQHHGGGLGFACLQKGEQLEGLVEGADTPRQHRVTVGLLHEQQLAGEEVLHRDQLRVGRDELVRLLLEGEADVDPERVLRSGAFEAGSHDPRARPP